jgi:hypothetical protein
MMIGPFIITFIMNFILKNKSYQTKRLVGIYLSILAILLLLARNIEIFVLSGFKMDYEIIPLQICHFANFVLLYAFWKKSDTAFGLAFLFNLPLACLSLIFADGLENYANILTFRGQAYIFGHMLIVLITLFAYINGFIRLNIKKYVSVSVLITTLYVLSLFINNIFRIAFDLNAHYFYTQHPESGTPLEFFFDLGKISNIGNFEVNVIYMISLIIFGYLVTFIIYLLAFELPRLLNRKTIRLETN